jgi:hypothetical protein
MRLSRAILNTPRLRHLAALELLSTRAERYRYLGAYSCRAIYRRTAKKVSDRSFEAWQAGRHADSRELDLIHTTLMRESSRP